MDQFIKDIAKEAGHIILSSKRAVTKTKGMDNNPVTEADNASNTFLIGEIKKKYPDHLILSEEIPSDIESLRHVDNLWIIDPLDGTTNFSHGFPSYCVTFAYVQHGIVQMGVVYDPERDELFFSEIGKGSTMNGNPIYVDDVDAFPKALAAIGFPYEHTNYQMISRALELLHKNGCFSVNIPAGLSCAYVSSGRISFYFEPELKIWDIAAGTLLIQEAGGMVCDISGNPLDIFHFNTFVGGGKNIIAKFLSSMK
jgi:myo-inositol-1(or 4)-monophosphatase